MDVSAAAPLLADRAIALAIRAEAPFARRFLAGRDVLPKSDWVWRSYKMYKKQKVPRSMNSPSKSAFRRTVALASILVVLMSAGHAHARCQPDASVILGELDIDSAKISRSTFEIVYAGVTGMGVTGYSIWLQSDSCRGSVVVNVDTDCRVIETFPRGNCSLQSLLK